MTVVAAGRVRAVGVSTAEPSFSVGHQGQFAQRHAVGQGDGQEADEGPDRLRVQQWAVDEGAVGVGAIRDSRAVCAAQASMTRIRVDR